MSFNWPVRPAKIFASSSVIDICEFMKANKATTFAFVGSNVMSNFVEPYSSLMLILPMLSLSWLHRSRLYYRYRYGHYGRGLADNLSIAFLTAGKSGENADSFVRQRHIVNRRVDFI